MWKSAFVHLSVHYLAELGGLRYKLGQGKKEIK